MDSGVSQKAKVRSKDVRYATAPISAGNEDPLIDLFTSGLRSDCIIKCKDRQWKLHTVILSSRSTFFSALFEGHFMESSSREVILDDNDPEALHVVLRYLYVRSSRCWLRQTPKKTPSQRAQFEINVIITADQIGVLDLAQDVAESLRSDIVLEAWDDNKYADTMTETMIPAIYGKPVCAVLERLKHGIMVSVIEAFRESEGPLDQINLVLCQHPELNRQVLEELVRHGLASNTSTPFGLRGW